MTVKWAVPYYEQKSVAEELADRVAELEVLGANTIILNNDSPTQTDWEVAYVQQNSRPLPIPVGASLVWHNLKTGEMVAHTTAWDQENGSRSSGKVYPVTSPNIKSTGLRLIGSIGLNAQFMGVTSNLWASGMNVGKILQMNRQARALWIFFNLRNVNAAGMRINVSPSITENDDDYVGGYTLENNGSRLAAVSASNTVDQPLTYSSYASLDVPDAAKGVSGFIWMDNPYFSWDETNMTPHISTLKAGFSAINFVSGYTPATIKRHYAYRVDSRVPLSAKAYLDLFPVDNNSSSVWHRNNQGYIYGWYGENTPLVMGEA